MKPEFFALIMTLLFIALYFTGGSGDQVDDAIRKSEDEPDKLKRLEILRKADQSLRCDHPRLLLKLALAAMAVAYEKISWVERLTFLQEAKCAAVRGLSACIQKGINPLRSKLPHNLRATHKEAEEQINEARRYIDQSKLKSGDLP